jgi:hypothetical protein
MGPKKSENSDGQMSDPDAFLRASEKALRPEAAPEEN